MLKEEKMQKFLFLKFGFLFMSVYFLMGDASYAVWPELLEKGVRCCIAVRGVVQVRGLATGVNEPVLRTKGFRPKMIQTPAEKQHLSETDIVIERPKEVFYDSKNGRPYYWGKVKERFLDQLGKKKVNLSSTPR